MSELLRNADFATPAGRQRLRAALGEDLSFRATLAGEDLAFRTTWGLFSPRGLDSGTILLAEHLEVAEGARCVDLGCGYGPLGLWMARRAGSAGRTLLLDKDLIAVEYARRNALENRLDRVEARASNGFSAVAAGERFDVVVSNLPAKVGRELLYTFVLDAHERMAPGATIWVVTITGLRRFIQRAFDDVFGNYDKVKQGRDYTVARAVRTPAPGERG